MGRFYKGRTETIRPLTTESQEAFVLLKKCVNDPSIENLLILAGSIRRAEKVHNINIKKCLKGQGFDRHLSALNVTAQQNQIKVNYFPVLNWFWTLF